MLLKWNTEDRLRHMSLLTIIVRLVGKIRSAVSAAIDALPPYRRIEGLLTSKEAGIEGRYYIYVGHRRVEVDWLTYDTLGIGENLRIRATRSYRAVNIDRLLS